MPGVKSVVSGYAAGKTEKPTYKDVCSGTTGHAEVVQIEYDPAVTTYEKLLEMFWHIHDPTTLNRQGNDVGTQYRSIILYHNDAQKAALRGWIEAGGRFLVHCCGTSFSQWMRMCGRETCSREGDRRLDRTTR